MTGKYQISYTPEAYTDLGDIYSYIALTLQERRVASDLVRRIRRDLFPARIPGALLCGRLGTLGLYGNA